MASVTIELPSQTNQTEFNLRRWEELLDDPVLAKIEGRIETDRFGRIIMSPPPAANHGGFQFQIGFLLRQNMPNGRVTTECPISTADGVKAADVTWASSTVIRELGSNVCFPVAPEICVEVLSPDNTKAEIREKMILYFDAGAEEVWVCSRSGEMSFYGRGSKPLSKSNLCPKFPKKVELD